MLNAQLGIPVGNAVTLSFGAQNLLNSYPEENPLAADGTGNLYGQFSPFGFNGALLLRLRHRRVGHVTMSAVTLLQDA